MANTIDYSKLKKASEVLETASHTTIPTATRAQASHSLCRAGGQPCLSPRECLRPSRGSPSTTSRDIGGGLLAKSCFLQLSTQSLFPPAETDMILPLLRVL